MIGVSCGKIRPREEEAYISRKKRKAYESQGIHRIYNTEIRYIVWNFPCSVLGQP